MSRFEVETSGLNASVGQLLELERELGGLRDALEGLEGPGAAGWSGEVVAAVGSAEVRWAGSVGAMEAGAHAGAEALSHTSVAYQHVDAHVMPARADGP